MECTKVRAQGLYDCSGVTSWCFVPYLRSTRGRNIWTKSPAWRPLRNFSLTESSLNRYSESRICFSFTVRSWSCRCCHFKRRCFRGVASIIIILSTSWPGYLLNQVDGCCSRSWRYFGHLLRRVCCYHWCFLRVIQLHVILIDYNVIT